MVGEEKNANARKRPPRRSRRARMALAQAQASGGAPPSIHNTAGQAHRSQPSTLSATAPPFYANPHKLSVPGPAGQAHPNVMPSHANPAPVVLDNPLAPPNAPRGPRSEREGRNRPNTRPSTGPSAKPEAKQLVPFDHSRQDACEEYLYRGTPEYAEWKKIRKNLRRSRLGRIGELTGEQRIVPQNFTEFLEHKAAMKSILEEEQQERDQAKQKMGELDFEVSLNGIAAVEPFKSSVLGQETIWTSISSDWRTDWNTVSPWPSNAELREDGDERHTSQYGRHLPCPREVGNGTQSWKQKPYKPASELDRVNPVPDRVFFRLPRDELGSFIDDEDEPGNVALVAKNPFEATAVTKRETLSSSSSDRWISEIGRENSHIRRNWALPSTVSNKRGLELIRNRMRNAGLENALSALRIMHLPPVSSSHDTHSHREQSLVARPSSRVSAPSSASNLPSPPHNYRRQQEQTKAAAAAMAVPPPTWSVGPSPTAEQLENDPIFKSFAVLYRKPARGATTSHLYEGGKGNKVLASHTSQPRLTAASILPEPQDLIKPAGASTLERIEEENDEMSSEKAMMP